MLTCASSLHLLGLSFLCSAALAQSSGWTNPPSSKPAFTSVYTNGNFITLSWQGLNSSLCDLWLTSYDTNNTYALRLAANINVTLPGTLPWSITVNETEIAIDNRFELKFVPGRTDITLDVQYEQIVSPGFLLIQSSTALPSDASTATIGATLSTASVTDPVSGPASIPSSSPSTSPPPTSPSTSSSGLSIGGQVGLAVGVTVAVICILALLFWVLRLRRRVQATSNHHSWSIIPESSQTETTTASTTTLTQKRIPGLHEVVGDRRHPTELSSTEKKRSVYEMPG